MSTAVPSGTDYSLVFAVCTIHSWTRMVSLVISTLKTHCWPVGTERSVLPTGRATEMVLRAAARWCFGQRRERERERDHRVPQDPAVVQQTVAVEKGEASTRAGPLSLLRAFSSRCPGAAARLEQGTRGSTAVLLSLRLVPARRSSAKRRLSQRMRPRTYSSAQLLNVTQHGLAHRLCA